MIIESIADYLEDQGVGTVNTDIFLGELPLDKSDCIALISAPSPAPDRSIPYYTQNIDVWARFSDYSEGVSKLQEVMDELQRKENYSITGYHVYLSYALGMIDDLDRDTERRHLLKVTFGVVYREDSSS